MLLGMEKLLSACREQGIKTYLLEPISYSIVSCGLQIKYNWWMGSI